MRSSVVMTLCALAACTPPPRTVLELVSAERRGELRLRLDNPGPEAIELEGYENRGVFHPDWHSRSIRCADPASSGSWHDAREPLVEGAFTGVRLHVGPGESKEIIVNHMARESAADAICRVSIRAVDGTVLVSAPFPARRLEGPN